MNRNLLNNNYLILNNFIKEDYAISLSKQYIDSKNELDIDKFVPDAFVSYNSILGLEILSNTLSEVSRHVEESLLPTYCYTRIYKSYDYLKKHTDRRACEISITLHLDSDDTYSTPWPIYIETPEGKSVGVSLKPGDAMIYLGCIAPHWREPYVGKGYYSQLFLHYVRSRGSYNDQYYDKNPKQCSVNDVKLLKKEYSLL